MYKKEPATDALWQEIQKHPEWKILGRTDEGEYITVEPVMIMVSEHSWRQEYERHRGNMKGWDNVSENASGYYQRNPMQTVTELIRDLGVPAHIKGYQYLRDAILMCVEEPEYLASVTGQLYPAIADANHTTPSRVERAIRHAIEVAGKHGNPKIQKKLFGARWDGENVKPTNSECIACLADLCRIEVK